MSATPMPAGAADRIGVAYFTPDGALQRLRQIVVNGETDDGAGHHAADLAPANPPRVVSW